ncbi:hypothetical protein GSI_08912 [Ganoderma sinense ZZ0214-1]|uniref:Protein kinase domain-containing protein n=1 Tax=Ganoderma sinense ZZ0214-1 TaxID=1077348 RepID=A0A2G8S513_9APHY|nr:hypothetical protein GSI_08912 [Ganoderma sinense ZZ0214-1]
MDHSSFADSQPREPKKTSQISPTTVDLQHGAAKTFIVDLALLGDPIPSVSVKEGPKSMPIGEHQIDNSNSPLSLHEVLEKTPLPPLSVDVPPDSLPSSTDTESVHTPIQPPGLPLPVDDTTVEPSETVPPVSPVEDRDTERATPASFSLSGLQPLRTLIPEDLLPDDLLVFDPNNISRTPYGSHPEEPVRYVRVFPKPKASQEPASEFSDGSPTGDRRDRPIRIARLYLKKTNVLGDGHHSSVYSAPLRLRLSAESNEESTVRVGVKTADARCGAHEMLRREAVAYNAFPRHLMEDRYPSVNVKPSQPAASSAQTGSSATPEGAAHVDVEMGDGTGTGGTAAPAAPTSQSDASGVFPGEADKSAHTPTPGHDLKPAVVPKFFGYYAAVDADGRVIDHDHSHPSCDKDDTCAVSWPTRLLLVEECGKPVVYRRLTHEQRIACYKLLKRLHAAGFTQGSVYERNILVQPGPLSAPPGERSDRTPSFRIIDFGRMKRREEFSSSMRFAQECQQEKEWAYKTLVDAFE